MKIAYYVQWDISKKDGVTRKIFDQVRTWQRLGHEVIIFCISTSTFDASKYPDLNIFYLKRKKENNIYKEYKSIMQVFQQVIKEIKNFNPDILYKRTYTYQRLLGKLMDAFPTIMELNTNDKAEMKLISFKGLSNFVKYLFYLYNRERYFKKVDGFVSVTHQISKLSSITKYNKPVLVIPNGINLETDWTLPHNPNPTEMPQLLFIGSPKCYWHGIDKIIQLAKNTQDKLHFHIIGSHLEDFSSSTIPQNITTYGYLNPDKYEPIFAKCDIGIGSLALHRVNMFEGSPLKVREYLAYGLPVILGCEDSSFVGKAIPDWVLLLPNTEKVMSDEGNVTKIINFANKMKGKRLIHKQTAPFIDITINEQEKLDFISTIVKNHVKSY